jgi:hypothetical protein
VEQREQSYVIPVRGKFRAWIAYQELNSALVQYWFGVEASLGPYFQAFGLASDLAHWDKTDDGT